MNRIPILDMEESQSLAENLGLVICLNSETLAYSRPPRRCSKLLRRDSIIGCRRSRSDFWSDKGKAYSPPGPNVLMITEFVRCSRRRQAGVQFLDRPRWREAARLHPLSLTIGLAETVTAWRSAHPLGAVADSRGAALSPYHRVVSAFTVGDFETAPKRTVPGSMGFPCRGLCHAGWRSLRLR